MDALLGKTISSIPIYGDAFDSPAGSIEVCERGLAVKGSQSLKIPLGYARELRISRRLQLGKVEAQLTAFDVMGDRHELRFVLSEQHFFELEKACERK
ncbi:MAG: hypothetical protein QXH27_00360 [Candidatus Micrarchaeia archaeon]